MTIIYIAIALTTVLCFLIGLFLKSFFPKFSFDACWILALSLYFDLFSFQLGQTLQEATSLIIFLFLLFFSLGVGISQLGKKIKNIFLNGPIIAFLLLFLYLVGSSLLGNNTEYGIKKLLIFVVRGIVPGVCVLLIFFSYRKFSAKPLLIGGLIYAVVLLKFGHYGMLYPGRLVFEVTNPIWIARSLLLAATISLWYLGGSLVLRLIVLFSTIYAAYLTQSRGPFVSFFTANSIMLINFLKMPKISDKTSSIIKNITSITLLIIFIIVGLSFDFELKFFDKSRFRTLIHQNPLNKDENIQSRLKSYDQAIVIAGKNPFFGVGFGGLAKEGKREYPHNLVLEILGESGIIGVFLWSFFLMALLKYSIKNKIFLALFIQSILFFMTSGDFGSNYEYGLIGISSIIYQKNSI